VDAVRLWRRGPPTVAELEGAGEGAAEVAGELPAESDVRASRALRARAVRAFSAAVWAPLALAAREAAMRALVARAAALPPLAFLAAVVTGRPARAALTLRTRRDFLRAAALGWIAPTLAARSRALIASLRTA
jgi:hypothetical protein